jgi:hypothetical protein
MPMRVLLPDPGALFPAIQKKEEMVDKPTVKFAERKPVKKRQPKKIDPASIPKAEVIPAPAPAPAPVPAPAQATVPVDEPVIQEPPKRLKKVAVLKPNLDAQPAPLSLSAPTGPVVAEPMTPKPRVKRAPNAYALAVGKHRKAGKSFAEAAAAAKAELAKAKAKEPKEQDE